MEDMSQRKRREVAVLDLLERDGAMTSMGLARALGTEPEAMFHGRKLRHVIGDMVYDKLMKRREEKIKHGNKKLPTYAITDKGREVRAKYTSEKLEHFQLAPGVVFEKPEAVAITKRDGTPYVQPDDFNIRKGNATEVVEIPASRRELREGRIKPLMDAKPVKQVERINISNIVPLPDKQAPKTPPYPALGRPALSPMGPVLLSSAVGVEERLKALIASMNDDAGRRAFLEVAHVAFENEARLKRIEAALAAFTQVLSGAGATPKEAAV